MAKHQHQPEELRKRVSHLMAKLSDRDTESMAFTELDSICRNITPDFVPTFVSVVGDTRISDTSPLRRHSLRLISLLVQYIPATTLIPHFPRILSASLRRLRDPESAVRAVLIESVRSLAAAAPAEVLVSSLLRPLVDSLFHEQEIHPQAASAFSLAAVLDEPNSSNAADIPGYLCCLVPRLVKLARSPVFKAKPAVLTLLGSVAGAGGAKDSGSLHALVLCLVEFLGFDEWSARKAAAEALIRLAAAESDSLRGFKLSCVASFEARRFDKVKIVRDSMNRMLEAWRKIPDEALDAPPPQSHSQPSSSQEETSSVGKCPASSINGSSFVQSSSPFITTKSILTARRTPPPTSAAKKTGGQSHGLRRNSTLSRRKIQEKNSDWEVGIGGINTDSHKVICEDNLAERDGEEVRVEDNGRSRLEVRRVLFEKNCEDKMVNGQKCRSQMGQIHENVSSEVTGEVGGGGIEAFDMRMDCDLSLIQMKLVQIENQQSTLLDLVQKLVASSQNGINSLEMRVHSLKIDLDKISCDLDVSSRRLSNNDPATKTCRRLRGTGFLCSKLWKRTEGRYASRFLSYAHAGDRDCHDAFFKSSSFSTLWSKQKFRPCGRFEDSCAEFNSSTRGSGHFNTTTMQGSATFDTGIKHLQDGYI